MIATVTYLLFVLLAGLFAALSFWPLAAILGSLALIVAYRHEARWLTDKIAGRQPAPVPQHARHMRPTRG